MSRQSPQPSCPTIVYLGGWGLLEVMFVKPVGVCWADLVRPKGFDRVYEAVGHLACP